MTQTSPTRLGDAANSGVRSPRGCADPPLSRLRILHTWRRRVSDRRVIECNMVQHHAIAHTGASSTADVSVVTFTVSGTQAASAILLSWPLLERGGTRTGHRWPRGGEERGHRHPAIAWSFSDFATSASNALSSQGRPLEIGAVVGYLGCYNRGDGRHGGGQCGLDPSSARNALATGLDHDGWPPSLLRPSPPMN